MKIKYLFPVISFLLLINHLCLPMQAKSMIYDILAKGSEWTLNVDGEEGTLELLGGSGASTGGSGWRMTMDIRWQGTAGSLRAEADNNNSQQRVFLNVQRQNGIAIICEGYIAQESDRFMAGITRNPTGKTMYGAWYAIKKQTMPLVPLVPSAPSVGVDRKRPIRPDIIAKPPTDKPGPSLNTKIQPYKPTSQDTITFLADASHPSGVESITIYVNGQAVQTCHQNHCEYTGGPYGNSEIIWRVSAKSHDGGITYGYDKTISITQEQTGNCSISGKAYGSGAGSANAFFVILYGPDNLSLYRETQPFKPNGIYSFTGLPAGKYKLMVDTKADTPIGPHPAYKFVDCTAGPITNVNFELK